jgi:hypothetical protein
MNPLFVRSTDIMVMNIVTSLFRFFLGLIDIRPPFFDIHDYCSHTSSPYYYRQYPDSIIITKSHLGAFYPLSISIRSLLIVIVDLVVSIVLPYMWCIVSFKLRTLSEVIFVIISFTSLASITPGTVFSLFIIYCSAPIS